MLRAAVIAVLMSAAMTSAVHAQVGPVAQSASSDPVVQMREAQRQANATYSAKLLEAYAERHKKIEAAVVAAVKDADAAGKDPLVAKRDAHAKATKATEAEYEAKLKQLKAEHRAALDAAKKKGAAKS